MPLILKRPSQTELVDVTVGGQTFKASRRTSAFLLAFEQFIVNHYPHYRFSIIQGCYNTTVKASEGTHDFDACVDIRITGLAWGDVQTLARRKGAGAYHRTVAQGFTEEHVHMFVLPEISGRGNNVTHLFNTKVGKYIDGGKSLGLTGFSSQLDDYYRHALGLANHHDSGEDHSWFPPNIDKTIFNYNKWWRKLPRVQKKQFIALKRAK